MSDDTVAPDAAGRSQRLSVAAPGANDGIVSTASLIAALAMAATAAIGALVGVMA